MKRNFILPQAPAGQKNAPVFSASNPWLAPLAGYSDLPFRLLCREQGAAVCETEMVSAKGLFYEASATSAFLASCPEDQPLVVQLFGGDEKCVGEAVRLLRAASWLNLDFNMGCPVRKVFKQKAGAWLLGEPETALKIALTIMKEANADSDLQKARVGFKLRIGVQPGKSPLPDLAMRLEDAGANWLTLHPRWASQGYSGQADWEWIYRLVKRVSIPVMASGDLLTADAGLRCLKETGASSVMYARGALNNPAIFQDHLALCAGRNRPERKKANIVSLLLRHVFFAKNFGEGRRAFNKLRSLVPRYVRVFRGSLELRRQLSLCPDWDSLEALIRENSNQGE